MSARARKYLPGRVLRTVAPIIRAHGTQRYFLWHGKPTHVAVLLSLQASTLIYYVQRGAIKTARLNPKWRQRPARPWQGFRRSRGAFAPSRPFLGALP